MVETSRRAAVFGWLVGLAMVGLLLGTILLRISRSDWPVPEPTKPILPGKPRTSPPPLGTRRAEAPAAHEPAAARPALESDPDVRRRQP